MENITVIDLNQYNLNKLKIGTKFIYTLDGHYKKGLLVCKLENKHVMITLSTICSLKSGLDKGRHAMNYYKTQLKPIFKYWKSNTKKEKYRYIIAIFKDIIYLKVFKHYRK
jgi:hypothetical protein